jgi:hypothetical protein
MYDSVNAVLSIPIEATHDLAVLKHSNGQPFPPGGLVALMVTSIGADSYRGYLSEQLPEHTTSVDVSAWVRWWGAYDTYRYDLEGNLWIEFAPGETRSFIFAVYRSSTETSERHDTIAEKEWIAI